jgi:glycopeptide antibiotics resistance protein
MNFLLHFIFIAAFLLIYIIAIIILKPFRIHRKRPASTILIKASYLIYLACFLMMAYLILFFSANGEPAEEADEERVLNMLTVFSIFAFFIPNIGIMIRRRIGTWRVPYNYIVTALNILIATGMIWFMMDLPWIFRAQ